MNRMINIEGRDDLVRDTQTKAILSNDVEQLKAYKLKTEQSSRLKRVEEEQNYIKSELQEIKNILISLIQKESN